MSIVAERPGTAYEVREPSREGAWELIDGVFQEKPMGAESDWVASEISFNLRRQLGHDADGWVIRETTFQCFPQEPGRIRRPDVAYLRRARTKDGRLSRGHEKTAPSLVVEVVSPNDLAEEIEGRIHDFLQAGTDLAWVVYPLTRTVHVFRADGSAQRLTGEQALTGEGVLPDFHCSIAAFFETDYEAEVDARTSTL